MLNLGNVRGISSSASSCKSSCSDVTAIQDHLLDLVMGHATSWEEWCLQGMTRLGYVDCGLHQQRADPVPHVVLLVELVS